MSLPPSWELTPENGGGMVIRVTGDVDQDGARRVLDLAASLQGVTRVAIDLEGAGSIDEDAAILLVFQGSGAGPQHGHEILVITTGERSRDAVLRAYAGRRRRAAWSI